MTSGANLKAKYIKQQGYLVIVTDIEGEIELEMDKTGDRERAIKRPLYQRQVIQGCVCRGPVSQGPAMKTSQ